MTDPAALLRANCEPGRHWLDGAPCRYCTAAEEVERWKRRADCDLGDLCATYEDQLVALRQRAEKAEAELERLRGWLCEVLGPETDPQPRAGEEQR